MNPPSERPRVYLETTITSYLTARPSRDLVTAAHQQITRDWWENRRADFDLYVSELILREAQGGDSEAASRRLELLRDLPLLEVTRATINLAQRLVNRLALPERAAADAVHIALAAVHRMDYLLTWNCTHIANAALRQGIEAVCRAAGCEPPVICTPEELLGEK